MTTGVWAAGSRLVPYVTGHEYFRLRTIRISSDETRVTPQTLAEVAGLYEDASLWDVDPARIQSTLRDASWVRSASVARHFPWQVSLSVSRRRGVAAAIASGKAYLVDQGGVLFHEIEEASVPDLPYLTGWDEAPAQAERAERLRALLSVLESALARSIDVSELHMDADETVWLYATGIKASVRLGNPEHAATGLQRLAVAISELGPLADRARVIDTDYRDRIVIRGADDKLPAMFAAQLDKSGASQGGSPESSHHHKAGGDTAGGTSQHAALTAAAANNSQASADGVRKAARHG